MRSLTVLALACLLFFPIAPLSAQKTASSTQKTSQSSSNSSSNLYSFIGLGLGALGLSLFSSPASVASTPLARTRISFGGRVVSVIPCTLGLHITIVPAGAIPVNYIWTPGTITGLVGPPRTPGQQVLGIAAPLPIACATFTVPPVPLPGHVMFTVGTSLY
jgi:hypothetical protein